MSVNKRAGTLYEQMFVCEALARGLDVAMPVGDYSQYDAIVDSKGRLSKIQIKGTCTVLTGKSGYNINTSMGCKSNAKKRYGKDVYDYLAAVILRGGDRIWYIIPRKDVGNRMTIKLYPNPESEGMWEKYRYGWDLICKM